MAEVNRDFVGIELPFQSNIDRLNHLIQKYNSFEGYQSNERTFLEMKQIENEINSLKKEMNLPYVTYTKNICPDFILYKISKAIEENPHKKNIKLSGVIFEFANNSDLLLHHKKILDNELLSDEFYLF